MKKRLLIHRSGEGKSREYYYVEANIVELGLYGLHIDSEGNSAEFPLQNIHELEEDVQESFIEWIDLILSS